MEFKFSALYTDLYQLTMGHAYFLNHSHTTPVTFDYYFRKIPFRGGYVIFAGLDNLLKALESFQFSLEDINYLTEQGFDKEYLTFLKKFKFKGSIHAPREGEIVFPTEPLLRIEGSMIEVQLIESMVLNILNFESLIATKASRIRSVSGNKSLSEFGLRRAQGLGAIFASRAAIIGGFDSTSNVYAAKEFGLKSAGTMAHSYIQLYEDELTAFRKYAQANPDNTILLVDTYDTLNSGIPNAIKVAKEMEKRDQQLQGIRLDSGDLSFFARKARQMLDDAGLQYIKIAASNQLDEYVIRSLEQQQAPIDIFGIGTNLVTGQPDAALDGVFKMVMADNKPRIKLSENIHKTTLPGNKQVYRFINHDGYFLGIDAMTQLGEGIPQKLIAPFDQNKSTICKGYQTEKLLKPIMIHGEIKNQIRSVEQIKEFSAQRLARLPKEYKRFENPHIYKVSISSKTRDIREELRSKYTQ